MNGKRYSESKARKNGFYLALAVCLVAVGIAAWSTYDAVQSYTGRTPSSTAEADPASRQAQDVRSGQSELPNEDPEAPRTTSSTPARQTAGTVQSRVTPAPETTVSSKADTPSKNPEPVESTPEEENNEAQIPVNAPMYERSTEMIFPLETKEITKAYSSGAPVYSQTMKDWRIHTGADLLASSGDNVLACANGLVKQVYTDTMLGNVALIEHGDYEFFYCGLGENFQIKAGDIVTQGQVIGVVTAVPFEAAEEPHLHLEIRRDSVYVDPETVIGSKE